MLLKSYLGNKSAWPIFLHKSLSLAAALGVTEFTTNAAVDLATLGCIA
jgi:hypothetical protein